MKITIAKLAAEYNSEPYEIAAALDLGVVPDDCLVDSYFAHDVLDLIAVQRDSSL